MKEEDAVLRRRMVEQIAARGIQDSRVLKAMGRVPRHRFVPPEQWDQAYEDRPLPIALRQTISQPFIVAYMTQRLELTGAERVLEVGTGSGYQTALLADLAREVFSIEVEPQLAEEARLRLAELGCRNVRLRVGDGLAGWKEEAPFDRVLITASVPFLPPVLLEELLPEGRLIAPVGLGEEQKLVQADRRAAGLQTQFLLPVVFVQAHGTPQA